MNKVILFIGLCVLLGGCSKNNNSMSDRIYKEKAPVTISLENAYEVLIQEKIQDHIDTQKLQSQYPDFKQNVDTMALLNLNYQETIADIILLDPITLENASNKNIRTVIIYANNKQDTILSNITRTKVIIDGEEIISSKVILKAYKE
ncbi:hypothetical protein [Dokdonia pacifica]|uniref:Uncharacterized protein n=1 Tax=Dokdonia pacifica TaxID=1627892 RepID=A0A239BND2_9FLAO|nr:hypothetical protein [Dokdonia pacifica]SNS08901.1 hypothetical protein SAMN06265376_106286 [Dokdonia pacifica]